MQSDSSLCINYVATYNLLCFISSLQMEIAPLPRAVFDNCINSEKMKRFIHIINISSQQIKIVTPNIPKKKIFNSNQLKSSSALKNGQTK